MALWLWALLWLGGTAAITGFSVTRHAPAIERLILDGVRDTVTPLADMPIMISVSDHVVTLSGSVPDASRRAAILAAANDAPGIRQVIDRLVVEASPPTVTPPPVVPTDGAPRAVGEPVETPTPAPVGAPTPVAVPDAPVTAERTGIETAVETAAVETAAVETTAADIRPAPIDPTPTERSTASRSTDTHSPTDERGETRTDESPPGETSSEAPSPDSAPPDETPSEAPSPDGTSPDETPSEAPPSDGTSPDETPSEAPSPDSTSLDETPSGAPASDATSLDVPAGTTPLDGQPVADSENPPGLPSLRFDIDGGVLSIDGTLSENDDPLALVEAAMGSFELDYVSNAVETRADVSTAAWLDVLISLLPTIARLEAPGVEVSERRMTLRGTASNSATRDEIIAATLERLGDYALVERIALAAPDDVTSESTSDSAAETRASITTDVPRRSPADALKADLESLPSLRVLFRSGSDRLTETSLDTLDAIAAALLRHPTLPIGISGHTDAVGAASINLRLSQLRANAVREYLVSRGVRRERLTARGHGESLPIADNTTAAGRAANRRIEFVY